MASRSADRSVGPEVRVVTSHRRARRALREVQRALQRATVGEQELGTRLARVEPG